MRGAVAPYAGVASSNKYSGTTDMARAAGERVGGARLVLGVRIWI